MRIIAFDPGKQNFAYAVIVNGRCIRHGHVRTVTDLNVLRVRDEIGRFYHDVSALLSGYSNDWLAFERMQHRPNQGGGAVVEYINLMIGCCMTIAYQHNMKLYPVSPATWKNHLIRQLGIDRKRFTMATQKLTMKLPAGSKHKTRRELVQGVLAGQTRAVNLTPHEGDAVGIGCYVWQQLTGMSIVQNVLG